MPVVFVHIPKTAGRTVNEAAKGAGSPFLAMVVNTEEQLEEGLHTHGDIERIGYIGGHFRLASAERLIFDTMGDVPCEYVSLLREPMERAYSFYLFLLRVKNAIPHVSSAIADRDFDYFLDFMYEHGDWQLRDAQCWLLCGERSSQQAIEAIERRLDLLGITEDFGRFYEALRQFSTFPFPPKAAAQDQNVAPRANSMLDVGRGYKPENWRAQISASTTRKLEAMNLEDFALYDYVQRRGGLIIGDRWRLQEADAAV